MTSNDEWENARKDSCLNWSSAPWCFYCGCSRLVDGRSQAGPRIIRWCSASTPPQTITPDCPSTDISAARKPLQRSGSSWAQNRARRWQKSGTMGWMTSKVDDLNFPHEAGRWLDHVFRPCGDLDCSMLTVRCCDATGVPHQYPTSRTTLATPPCTWQRVPTAWPLSRSYWSRPVSLRPSVECE